MVTNTFDFGYKVVKDGRTKLTPGYKRLLNNGEFLEINADGYIGKPANKKMSTKFRAVAFGDSATFGNYGGNVSTPWPVKLERLLIKRAYDIEVINAAVEGTNLSMCYDRVIETNKTYEYNMAILFVGWNNIYTMGKRAKGGIFAYFEKMRDALTDKQMILCTLPTLMCEDFKVEHVDLMPGNQLVMGGKGTKIATQEEIDFMVDLVKFYHQTYLDFAKTLNVPCIDLFDHVYKYPFEEKMKMFFDPPHPYDRGHEIISEFIADELIRQGIICKK